MYIHIEKSFVQVLGIMLIIVGGAYILFGGGPSAPPGQSVVQSNRSYTVEVTSSTDGIKPGQAATITYRIKNNKGEIVKNFEIAHEKIMHFIVVRKDLQEFQHLHPDFNKTTREFSIMVTFPTDGWYRIFPDFIPAKSEDNPQLLPTTLFHDIIVGNLNAYQPQSVIADTLHKKIVDGYEITSIMPQELKAGTPLVYRLTIAQNGQLVRNLETYLGARGHSIILKADTLDFIHTHVESDDGFDSNLTFPTLFREAGRYKIFTQFQHKGRIITIDHVISVAPNTGALIQRNQREYRSGHRAL